MSVERRRRGNVQSQDADIESLSSDSSDHRVRPGRREQQRPGVLQDTGQGDR